MDHYIILIVIMFVCGILGGTVNYFYVETEEKKKILRYIDYNYLKSLFTGIVASLLVPLFLNMISSSIIEESKTDNYKLFIFGGFCLIAAISSKTFIQTLSSKVIQKLNEVKQDVKAVKTGVDPLIQKQTEPDEIDEKLDFTFKSMINPGGLKFSEVFSESDTDKVKILKSLAFSRYTYRSSAGLIKDTGFDTEKVTKLINELISLDFAAEIITGKGPKYYITTKGRDELNSFV